MQDSRKDQTETKLPAISMNFKLYDVVQIDGTNADYRVISLDFDSFWLQSITSPSVFIKANPEKVKKA